MLWIIFYVALFLGYLGAVNAFASLLTHILGGGDFDRNYFNNR